LGPSASTTVRFTITPDKIGTFNVTVGRFTGSFSVTAPHRQPTQPVPTPTKPTRRLPVSAKWFGGLLLLAIVIGLSSHFWPTNSTTTIPMPTPTSVPTTNPTNKPTTLLTPTPAPTLTPIPTPIPTPTPSPTPIPTAVVVSVTPIITNVSKISATRTQTITIQGEGFGNKEPYNGNSPYIEIIDVTAGLHAGHDANWVTINVAQWTDGQIVISGFTGSYAEPYRVLHAGDEIQVKVWNAQSGLGPAVYTVICSAP